MLFVKLEVLRIDNVEELRLVIEYSINKGYFQFMQMMVRDFPVKLKRLKKEEIQEYFRESVFRDRLEIVKEFLNYPEIDPTWDNNICLLRACENGYSEILKLFLNDSRIDPSVYNENPLKRSLLSSGSEKCAQLLLKDDRVDPRKLDSGVVKRVYYSKRFKIIKYLLTSKKLPKGVKINYNWMFQSCMENNRNDILNSLILDDWIDPHAKRNESIDIALDYRNTNVLIQILKKENSMNLTKLQTEKILQVGVENNKLFLVDYILEYLNSGKNDLKINLNEVMISASRYGRDVILKKLLVLDSIDPNYCDSKALFIACKVGKLESVKVIAEDERTVVRKCDLEVAVEMGNVKIVDFLLRFHCSGRKIQNIESSNVLNIASEKNRVEIVDLLFEYCKDIFIQKIDSALDMAYSEGNINIVSLLRKHCDN